MKPKIGLIWAQNQKLVIGANNAIPWYIPEDLKHFNQVTSGSTLIMGKATWFSLPPAFRPLPNRRNLVLSSDLSWEAPGAEVFSSFNTAFASVATEWVWVIGGSSVYSTSLMFADRLEVTQVNLPDVTGDTFAPVISHYFNKEKGTPASDEWLISPSSKIEYRFETYVR